MYLSEHIDMFIILFYISKKKEGCNSNSRNKFQVAIKFKFQIA